MKNIFICLFILSATFFSQTSMFSQRIVRDHFSHLTKEQIQEKKKTYLTEHLQLTPKEAEDLMGVLNELDEQRFNLWKSTSEVHKRIKSGESLSDDEYNRYFEMILNNRVKEAELERDYYSKCKTLISLPKLVKLEYVNRDFIRQIFRKKR